MLEIEKYHVYPFTIYYYYDYFRGKMVETRAKYEYSTKRKVNIKVK